MVLCCWKEQRKLVGGSCCCVDSASSSEDKVACVGWDVVMMVCGSQGARTQKIVLPPPKNPHLSCGPTTSKLLLQPVFTVAHKEDPMFMLLICEDHHQVEKKHLNVTQQTEIQ